MNINSDLKKCTVNTYFVPQGHKTRTWVMLQGHGDTFTPIFRSIIHGITELRPCGITKVSVYGITPYSRSPSHDRLFKHNYKRQECPGTVKDLKCSWCIKLTSRNMANSLGFGL